jgi:hypothetical protein
MSHEGEGEHNMIPRDGPCSWGAIFLGSPFVERSMLCFAAGKELSVTNNFSILILSGAIHELNSTRRIDAEASILPFCLNKSLYQGFMYFV